MDTDAIDAARRGDQKAQAALLRELQDPWFRMCLSLLGDAERARDATQETALRFLKQLPTFAAQSKLMTWSMGIVINVVREMRRTSNRAVLDDGQIADARPAPGEGPAGSASRSEEHRMLWSMLGELPQRQREVVVLRFFEELSVEETAAAMDCAQGTVKATLHQALRALRKKIERTTNE